MNDRDVLLDALREPAAVTALSLEQWDRLVRQCRGAKLLGRLAVLLDQRQLLDQVPAQVRPHLDSARAIADRHQRVLRWEVTCLRRVLGGLGIPIVLLKGAAYQMADLPPARGRLLGDIDIMVPKTEVQRVERVLLEHGWQPLNVHPYDQRYYRTWMHELPPLMHRDRQTVLDLHHTILPETGRLHPDPQKLFEAARRVGEGPFFVLAPADMVLHSAAHLFQDGDLAGGLRDLIDLDDLLRHFGQEASFWGELLDRAKQQDLCRPLYYALRFAGRCLRTPIPEPMIAGAAAWGPGRHVRWLMDALVSRALEPGLPGTTGLGTSVARWVLYARSHWLRMPPWLLACHLTRKALRRWFQYEDELKPIAPPVLPDASAETPLDPSRAAPK